MFESTKIEYENGKVKVNSLPPQGWYDLTTQEQFAILHCYVEGEIKIVQFLYSPMVWMPFMQTVEPLPDTTISWYYPCDSCTSNPKNNPSASGVCHCTLPSWIQSTLQNPKSVWVTSSTH